MHLFSEEKESVVFGGRSVISVGYNDRKETTHLNCVHTFI